MQILELLEIKVIQRCEFHGCLFSIMPERCPGDHPHLYSFFKHEISFIVLEKGIFLEDLSFNTIQFHGWQIQH
jgi:hypothetical protein